MLSRCAGPACLSDRAGAPIRLVNKDFGKSIVPTILNFVLNQ